MLEKVAVEQLFLIPNFEACKKYVKYFPNSNIDTVLKHYNQHRQQVKKATNVLSIRDKIQQIVTSKTLPHGKGLFRNSDSSARKMRESMAQPKFSFNQNLENNQSQNLTQKLEINNTSVDDLIRG